MAELLIEKQRACCYLPDLRPRNTARQPANNVRPDMVEAPSISGADTAGTAIAAIGAASKAKAKNSLELVFIY
jgi:hypothetical protein